MELLSTIANLLQICDAQHKADGIKYVGLPAAVQPSDRVEIPIEVWHSHSLSVGLETIDGDFLDVHGVFKLRPRQSCAQTAAHFAGLLHAADHVYSAGAVMT